MSKQPPCSLCGKEHHQVKRLVLFVGPDKQNQGVCNECVSMLVQMLAEEMPDWREEQMALLLAIKEKDSN